MSAWQLAAMVVLGMVVFRDIAVAVSNVRPGLNQYQADTGSARTFGCVVRIALLAGFIGWGLATSGG